MMSTRLPASPRAFDVLLLKGSILGLLLLLSSWLYASGEYLSLAIACALAYLAILYWAAARFGVFDARVLFLGVSGLYPFTPVLDTYIVGNDHLNVEYFSLTLLLTMFLFSGFFAVSLLDVPGNRKIQLGDDLMDRVSFNLLVALLFGAFFLYLALLYRDIGFEVGRRTRAEVAASSSPLFAVTRLGFIVGLLVLVAKLKSMRWVGEPPADGGDAAGNDLVRRYRPVAVASILIAAYAFVDVVLLGDRRLFVAFALASLCMAAPRRIPLAVVIALPLLLLAFLLLPLIRNAPIEDWTYRLSETNIRSALSPGNFDFGAFGRVADDILSSWPITRFPTYADALLTLIPQALYPDRPEPMSVWFVRNFHPKDWEVGGGLAFNLVIEALLNLGYSGPLTLGLLLGLLFNYLIDTSIRNRLMQGLLVFTLVFAMRFDMVTLLKTITIVAAAAVGWLFLVVRPKAGTRPPSPAQST